MYDEGVVIGRVVGREKAGPNSEYLIVEDRSKPQYPTMIAGELYGEQNRALFSKVGLGDLARIVGSIRSFKSKSTNKWWTTFSVFSVTNLSPSELAVSQAPAPVVAPRDRVPGEDDGDDLGF